MDRLDLDVLQFFDGHLSALPLFEAVDALLRAEFPTASRRVQKTQITYSGRHVFACLSFARVGRKAERPDPFLTLTLGLPEPPASPRVAVRTEVRPGRWTVHIVLGSEEDLDRELRAWLRAAWDFAERPSAPR